MDIWIIYFSEAPFIMTRLIWYVWLLLIILYLGFMLRGSTFPAGPGRASGSLRPYRAAAESTVRVAVTSCFSRHRLSGRQEQSNAEEGQNEQEAKTRKDER